MIGQLLQSRYQVIRELGKGAFGQTYLAQDTQYPGKPYCVVKHLQPDDPRSIEKAKQLFAKEAITLAKLGKHDQIPELKAHSETEFYLVQEFIDGRPLRDEMPPKHDWKENEVIVLLQEILSVLVFIHDEGVIHRDIKPDNIMRRQRDNKLVLIDFGAIKEKLNTPETGTPTVVGSRIYTLGYAPPEQTAGKPKFNSDIYALGMTAIETLTGVYPHLLEEDNDSGEIIWRNNLSGQIIGRNDAGKNIWQNKVPVSSGLAAILSKMVHFSHRERYQSAGEVLQELQKLIQVQTTNTGGAVNQLTLEWQEAGQVKNIIIRDGQPSKNPGTFRIGRDPAQCDVVFSNMTVSGLHVEIFFNQQQKRFYVRNLRQTNPPIVDEKALPTGEAPLYQGSNVQLGQINLRVTAISLGQVSSVAPTELATATKPTEVATAYQSQASTPIAPTENPNVNKKPIQISPVLGIDLGTTKSIVTGMSDGKPIIIENAEGSRSTPSVIAFGKNGNCLFGETALRQAVKNPENTFYSVLRFIGRSYEEVSDEITKVAYKVLKDTNGNVKLFCPALNKQFAPEEILVQILRKLVEDANNKMGTSSTQIVISVPACFNDSQRQAVRDAGKIAGLEVLRVINETSAAALAYGFDKKSNQTILVFDLGGGNFSVSVLIVDDGTYEVLATCGDTHLGGADFDHKLVDYLAEEFEVDHKIDLRKDKQALQRLIEAAQKAKTELSSATQTEINLPFIAATQNGAKNLEMTVTRARFEKLCSDLIDRCRIPIENVLRNAKLNKSDIDEILLIGGSTRIPAIQEMLKNLLDKEPKQNVNRDEAVALGAAIQAGILAGETTGVLLLDVTPLSLGVETLGGVMTKIIPRNTTIPTKKSEVFSTAVDGQTSVEIHILQGEREMASDNNSLGFFRFDDIPPTPRGIPQIEVVFDIDANGITNVIAKEKSTGKEQSVTMTGVSTSSKPQVKHPLTKYQSTPSANPSQTPQEQQHKQQELSYDTAIDVPLNAKDLQSGTQVKIVIEDESITVAIPANTKYGQTLRVRGKGNLNPLTQQRGNIFLRLIEAQYIYQSSGIKEFIQIGVESGITKQSLGVETLGGIMTVIIPRNSAVPIKYTEIFSTAKDNQNNVEINVLQGEKNLAKDNKSLAVSRLNGIPPAPQGEPQIEVIFEINPYGFLSVLAWEKLTQTSISVLNCSNDSSILDADFNSQYSESENASATLDDPQPQSWNCIYTINAHSSSLGQGVSSIAFSADGKFIVSGGILDSKVKVFNLQNLNQVFTMSGHKSGVRTVAFCPDGRLFSGSDDKTIKIWNWEKCQEIKTLNLHSNAVTSIAWSRNSKYFASVSDDKTIYIEDTENNEIMTINGHDSYVQYVSFSDDNEYIVSAGCDKKSKVWKLDKAFKANHDNTNIPYTYFTGHDDHVTCAQFNPQNEILATGGRDGKIMLWNYKTKESIYDIAAHSSGTLYGVSLAFSPDGNFLASGGPDHLIKIWHVKTGQQLATLLGHSKAVTSIAFSLDREILVSGSGDGTIKLWLRQ